MKTILSLGAGVQSSTLALMAAHGEITPMPTCAIFADTGNEPGHVYEHLAFLKTLLPFPVYEVSAGNLIADALADKRSASLPYFTEDRGMHPRQCTSDYKIAPVDKKIRELLGLKRGQHWPKEKVVDKWFGISLDEIQRMRVSQRPAVENQYPLIDKRMNRWDCLNWMRDNGYPKPPRSACIVCPFHDNEEWHRMKAENPNDWAFAVSFDEQVRNKVGNDAVYLHRDRVPLDQVDLSTAADHGQLSMLDECEGLCGV